MSTVSTNTFANGLRSVVFAFGELGLLLLSVGLFLIGASSVSDIFDMFEAQMMGMFVLSMLAAAPVVFRPSTFLGATFAVIFRILSGAFYVFGWFMFLPYIMGVSLVIGMHGWGSEFAPAALFWMPVYFGLPALIGFAAMRNDE